MNNFKDYSIEIKNLLLGYEIGEINREDNLIFTSNDNNEMAEIIELDLEYIFNGSHTFYDLNGILWFKTDGSNYQLDDIIEERLEQETYSIPSKKIEENGMIIYKFKTGFIRKIIFFKNGQNKGSE